MARSQPQFACSRFPEQVAFPDVAAQHYHRPMTSLPRNGGFTGTVAGRCGRLPRPLSRRGAERCKRDGIKKIAVAVSMDPAWFWGRLLSAIWNDVTGYAC